MPKTNVTVNVLMTRREFFCDIFFKVLEATDETTPVAEAWVELLTPSLELITKVQTDTGGMAVINDMPQGETYNWKVSHPDFEDATGVVTTVES